MSPVEYTTETPPRYDIFRKETETYCMTPSPDGSLTIHEFPIKGINTRTIRILMKQAVRASEIGKPEKQQSGDYLGVCSENIRAENGRPYIHATLAVVRDFLSCGPEDADFWKKMGTNQKIIKFAESERVPISPESKPDEWAASYLRKHTRSYMRHLTSAFNQHIADPYDALVLLANLSQYEVFRHNLHETGKNGNIPMLVNMIASIPDRLVNCDMEMFRPHQRVIQYASEVLGMQPSQGLGGDIQTLMLYLQVNQEEWVRANPNWRGKKISDVVLILRSNADQITRFSTESKRDQILYAQNNNFLVDFHASHDARYNLKDKVYWMTGIQRSSLDTRLDVPMGLPLYSFAVHPILPTEHILLETISDGFILKPSTLYKPDSLMARSPKTVIENVLDTLQNDPFCYDMYIRDLRARKEIGWIPREPSILDHIVHMSENEYMNLLKLRNDLALQRADDATFVGIYS